MIKPTVGRVVWFYPGRNDAMPVHPDNPFAPLAALVTHVHTDTCINLSVFDPWGGVHGRQEVFLNQHEAPPPNGAYAAWMPYQKAVAKGELAPTLHA